VEGTGTTTLKRYRGRLDITSVHKGYERKENPNLSNGAQRHVFFLSLPFFCNWEEGGDDT
jgi:hypothetical protein